MNNLSEFETDPHHSHLRRGSGPIAACPTYSSNGLAATFLEVYGKIEREAIHTGSRAPGSDILLCLPGHSSLPGGE